MHDDPIGSSRASTAPIFERLGERYDAWYEGPAGRIAFPLEVGCLAPFLGDLPGPALEVGVGSGRFARALGIGFGVDPARLPLFVARRRGIRVVQGVGEHLPFRSAVFGGVVVVVTLCFADDPEALLAEARRVLRPDGAVVLGMVFADGPWGEWYREKGEAGHPFYAAARFLTRHDVRRMTDAVGLRVVGARSTLLQPPSDRPRPEAPVDGDASAAGFVAWKAVHDAPSASPSDVEP